MADYLINKDIVLLSSVVRIGGKYMLTVYGAVDCNKQNNTLLYCIYIQGADNKLGQFLSQDI
jgi:hypothetical protein